MRTERPSRTSPTSRSTTVVDLVGGHVRGADLALGLGVDVPVLPGGAAALHRRHDPVGGLGEPRGVGQRRRGSGWSGSARRGSSGGCRCGVPRTSSASRRQASRCSASERGSCLASRVSSVACWASWSVSTGVGGRPWVAWNSAASSLRRASTLARRLEKRWFSSGSTPTISRTGRLRASGFGRSVEPDPQGVAQVPLERGVVGLRGGDLGLVHAAGRRSPATSPSERVWTLFATATWVCRSGSPARESRWVNAVATRPRTLTWRTRWCPGG